MDIHILASEDVQKARMEMCRACEHFLEFPQACHKCACYMPFKTKLKSSECPLHKWEKEQ